MEDTMKAVAARVEKISDGRVLYVDREFERLVEAVQQAHLVFSDLMGRLEKVRVENGAAATIEEGPEPIRSELAGQIAYQADQVQRLTVRMRTVLAELDL